MSPIPSLFLNSLRGTLSFTLTSHIHLNILISVCWNATSFSFPTGQVSLPCNILLCTQLLYSLPLTINTSSGGTNCVNLFHPIQILASRAATVPLPPFTLNISPKEHNFPLIPDLHWHQYLHLCDLYWLLDLSNLYKQHLFFKVVILMCNMLYLEWMLTDWNNLISVFNNRGKFWWKKWQPTRIMTDIWLYFCHIRVLYCMPYYLYHISN